MGLSESIRTLTHQMTSNTGARIHIYVNTRIFGRMYTLLVLGATAAACNASKLTHKRTIL